MLSQIGLVSSRIGHVGGVIAGVQLWVGLADNTNGWTSDDYKNAIQFGLGIASIFVGPWWALGMGTCSLIIAIKTRV